MKRSSFLFSRLFLKSGLWLIFLTAIALRIGDYESRYRYVRMNDPLDHLLYIEYVRTYFTIPSPSEGFEYPQEPLYYWLAATVYSPSLFMEKNAAAVAGLGLILNLGGLVILFCSLKYLSSWLARYGLLIFIGLTPSLVLHCACIGNDGLAGFFGMAYFFCLLRSNRHSKKSFSFWSAITVFMLGLFTKLNGIILILSLPWLFWQTARDRLFGPRTWVRAGIVFVLGIIWLGSVLHHAWLPDQQEYRFVNWEPFPGQTIEVSKLMYAFHFSLPDLIEAGQTTTHASKFPLHPEAVDNVRFSFPTWIVGNMLLGSWDYNADLRVHEAATFVIIFGTIFSFGFSLFAALSLFGWVLKKNSKFSLLNVTALALTIGMIVMALLYTLTHPTVCTADFRLEAVTFAWLGYCCCRGWTIFPRSWALQTTAILFLIGYVISSLTLYGLLYFSPQSPNAF